MGLAHKRCNTVRSNQPLPDTQLLAMVRLLMGDDTLRLSEVYALVYKPHEAQCNEFVVDFGKDLYYNCDMRATHIVRYNLVEGWTPKCDKHMRLALDAGVETLRWQEVSREMQDAIIASAA